MIPDPPRVAMEVPHQDLAQVATHQGYDLGPRLLCGQCRRPVYFEHVHQLYSVLYHVDASISLPSNPDCHEATLPIGA